MSDVIDQRLVRISIEVDGVFKVYEDLDILARITKSANPLQNTCEVTVTNLSRATRNYLLTETSPFNKNKKPKRIIVEAGRQSYGVTRLFYGEITSASPSQPPDISLTLKAQTGAYAKGQLVARSGPALQSLKAIATRVATDISASLDFQATDKQISNYSFSGAALRQVEALSAAGGVDAYLDDETLVVKNRGVPLINRIRQVNAKTGMIGQPEVTEHGIKVKYLLDTNTVLGGALEVTSTLNPAVNGTYSIFGLALDVSTRQDAFWCTAECRRT